MNIFNFHIYEFWMSFIISRKSPTTLMPVSMLPNQFQGGGSSHVLACVALTETIFYETQIKRAPVFVLTLILNLPLIKSCFRV